MVPDVSVRQGDDVHAVSSVERVEAQVVRRGRHPTASRLDEHGEPEMECEHGLVVRSFIDCKQWYVEVIDDVVKWVVVR